MKEILEHLKAAREGRISITELCAYLMNDHGITLSSFGSAVAVLNYELDGELVWMDIRI